MPTSSRRLHSKTRSRQPLARADRRVTRSPGARRPDTFGISRIDSKATHGWFVRLGWQTTSRGKHPRFVGFFPDLRHGGKQKALAAAKAWQRYVLKYNRAPRKA